MITYTKSKGTDYEIVSKYDTSVVVNISAEIW
jgi:hypothetical protein